MVTLWLLVTLTLENLLRQFGLTIGNMMKKQKHEKNRKLKSS